jgi:hypothetical protein
MGAFMPPVTLNSFQGPCGVDRSMNGARLSNDRAWMLKRVQHDGTFGGRA